MSGQSTATEAPPAIRTQPKRRWPWVVGGVCVVTAVLFPTTPTVIWDGRAQRTIRIRITDNSMGYPVSGAIVTFMQARDYASAEHLDQAAVTEMLQRSHHLATTDERGEVTVIGQFGAGGRSSMLWRSGAFDVEGVLTISHPKHQTAEGMLEDYLRRKEFPIRTKNLDVHIFLSPK